MESQRLNWFEFRGRAYTTLLLHTTLLLCYDPGSLLRKTGEFRVLGTGGFCKGKTSRSPYAAAQCGCREWVQRPLENPMPPDYVLSLFFDIVNMIHARSWVRFVDALE
ncbi:MAG: hypothetical protein IH994_11680 [Proteobacteria bacterium]|nr:hypothetical protein [Pseudomonadota bacterium]